MNLRCLRIFYTGNNQSSSFCCCFFLICIHHSSLDSALDILAAEKQWDRCGKKTKTRFSNKQFHVFFVISLRCSHILRLQSQLLMNMYLVNYLSFARHNYIAILGLFALIKLNRHSLWEILKRYLVRCKIGRWRQWQWLKTKSQLQNIAHNNGLLLYGTDGRIYVNDWKCKFPNHNQQNETLLFIESKTATIPFLSFSLLLFFFPYFPAEKT